MNKQMPSVIAVVLTYNRKALVLEVLAALMEQDGVKPDILVVDNGSSDGTVDAIAACLQDKNVFYENTGKNLGGAGGYNYAIKKATQMGYERLWIMDDDCVPSPTALKELLAADKKLDGDFGWLSSIAYWQDGTLCRLNAQAYALGRRVTYYNADLIKAQTASFVSLYVKTSVVYNVGLNIKEFYMWADDWEFTRRASKQYPCYVVSQSTVIHKTAHNKSNNIAFDDADRLWRYKYAFRNEVYVLKQEGFKGYIHLILKTGFNFCRIICCSKEDKKEKLKMLFYGTREGIHFNPQIEYVEEHIK